MNFKSVQKKEYFNCSSLSKIADEITGWQKIMVPISPEGIKVVVDVSVITLFL